MGAIVTHVKYNSDSHKQLGEFSPCGSGPRIVEIPLFTAIFRDQLASQAMIMNSSRIRGIFPGTTIRDLQTLSLAVLDL